MEKEKIKEELIEILEYNGYYPTWSAIEKIVDEWESEKSSLLNIFRSNKNWNEENLMITFPHCFQNSIDENTPAIDDFKRYLFINVRGESAEYLALRNLISSYTEVYINEKIVEEFKDLKLQESFSALIKKGAKTTRVVRKACELLGFDTFKNFEKVFAKYADALSVKTQTLRVCVSLNPIDFLLMSNGNSWTSCHSINVDNNFDGGYQGCNKSGTISYMLDPVSFVFYTVKDNEEDFYSIQKKISRQMFSFDGLDDLLFQGRLYPDNLNNSKKIAFSEIVKNIISEGSEWLHFENTIKKDNIELSIDATCYPDWEISLSNFELFQLISDGMFEYPVIEIGAVPICIETGEKHTHLNSLSIPAPKFCAHCHGEIWEGDLHYISSNDEFYCSDCFTVCDVCHEYAPNSEVLIGPDGEHFCSSCVNVCPKNYEFIFSRHDLCPFIGPTCSRDCTYFEDEGDRDLF